MLSIGLLSAITLTIALVTWALWIKTRALGFVLGALFLYYWSLYGAWAILTGRDLGSYGYLFDELVSLTVDSTYLWTITLYGAFVFTVLLSTYFFIVPIRPRVLKRETRLVIKCAPLLVVSLIAGVLSYLLVSQSIFLSSQLGRSVYQLIRMDDELGANFSLHAIVNRIALVPASIALAVIFSGPDARYVVIRSTWLNTLAISAVVASMVLLCLLLGNKNELLFSTVLGVLVYVGNAKFPNWSRLSWIVVGSLILFPVINSTRSKSLDEFADGLNTDYLVDAFSSLGMTGETFAAHMSLYGVLDQEVPLVYGESFVSLFASVIPRSLWEDRPDDIYTYYIDSIDASVQQGFTIHHATGWYLNFGVVGLLAGGLLLGRLWAYFYNLSQKAIAYDNSLFWRVFGTFAFWAFTANLPNIIRAGIGGYKGFFFHALVAPIFVLLLCCRIAKCSPGQESQSQRHRVPRIASRLNPQIPRRKTVSL